MAILKTKIQLTIFFPLDFRIVLVQVVQGDLEGRVVLEGLVGQEGLWDTMEEGLGKYYLVNFC